MPSKAILEQKQALAADLSQRLKASVAGVIVNYSGISVADDTKLRKQLREAGVVYTVAKNTLIKRAAADAGLKSMTQFSTEQRLSPHAKATTSRPQRFSTSTQKATRRALRSRPASLTAKR